MTKRRMRTRSSRYNVLKLRFLSAFSQAGGWLNPPAAAVLVGFYQIRASYSYLLRLHRFGLLQRRRSARGPVLYRLSERGRSRLAWLQQI